MKERLEKTGCWKDVWLLVKELLEVEKEYKGLVGMERII
jgi:hypothetical protein